MPGWDLVRSPTNGYSRKVYKETDNRWKERIAINVRDNESQQRLPVETLAGKATGTICIDTTLKPTTTNCWIKRAC